MTMYTADFGIGTVLLIVFVVIPALKWSFWGARWGSQYGTRYGLRYARRWGAWAGIDEDDDAQPRGRRALQALRAELDGRLAEIDGLSARVAELENRLDFTERLLARRNESSAVAEQPETALAKGLSER